MKVLNLIRFFTFIFVLAICFTPQANSISAPRECSEQEEISSSFEDHIRDIYESCNLSDLGLDYSVFKYGLVGYYNLVKNEKVSSNKKVLSIADFRKHSAEKRFFVIDIARKKVLNHTWVAHGKNTGLVYASKFSNTHNSLQTSLGFYKTDNTYYGQHGYSLRLDGLERGVNHNARERAIVMHGAPYVCETFVNRHGRIGRSWGCPAIPLEEHKSIIDNIKWGNTLFIYSNDINYLNSSRYLNFYNAARTYASVAP